MTIKKPTESTHRHRLCVIQRTSHRSANRYNKSATLAAPAEKWHKHSRYIKEMSAKKKRVHVISIVRSRLSERTICTVIDSNRKYMLEVRILIPPPPHGGGCLGTLSAYYNTQSISARTAASTPKVPTATHARHAHIFHALIPVARAAWSREY